MRNGTMNATIERSNRMKMWIQSRTKEGREKKAFDARQYADALHTSACILNDIARFNETEINSSLACESILDYYDADDIAKRLTKKAQRA